MGLRFGLALGETAHDGPPAVREVLSYWPALTGRPFVTAAPAVYYLECPHSLPEPQP